LEALAKRKAFIELKSFEAKKTCGESFSETAVLSDASQGGGDDEETN
jgi:hypothetical protein